MTIMGEELLGIDDDDIEGDDFAVVGAGRRKRLVRLPKRPKWRDRNAAPGVPLPGEGMEPLPLTPNLNGGVFNAANLAINFEARPQRPFRGERPLATVVLAGGAAGIVVCDGIFVGTNLQLVELGSFDVAFFAPTAFGVRLALVQAEPGVLIRLPLRFVGAIGGGTATVSILMLGRTIS
jgi:hypothetical protein